jgi:Glycosyl transferases group 1
MALLTAAIPERRLTLPADLLQQRPGVAELVIHALAQLPDPVVVQLPNGLAAQAHLELLAAAYGVDERLSFGPARGARVADALLADEVSLAELVEALSEEDDSPASLHSGDEILRGERVGLVTNLPANYRIPLLNTMAKRLRAVECRFRAFFCAQSHDARPWLTSAERLEFEHEFLRSVALPIRRRPPLVPLNLEAALAAYRPTILLSAGFSPAVSGRVARQARRRKIAFGVWSGEHDRMGTAQGRARRLQRRRLLGRARFAIAYGSVSARYLRGLAPSLPTVIGRNSAPVPAGAGVLQANLPVELVTVGDAADARKGLDVVIDALRRRPEVDCRLRVIGGGALLSELESRASGDRRIEFVGKRNPAETQRMLRDADVFLFPTRSDIFGLALVEAMGAGLCVLVSPAAGAVDDLCVHRRNCVLVSGHNPEAWGAAIAEVVSDCGLRQDLGKRARSTVDRRWTIEHAADAMIGGLRLAVLTGHQHERLR